MIPLYAFIYFAVMSVAGSVLAVTRKNPVHSVLWVLFLFFHLAGMYVFLNAEFIAAIQIIVYAGAILVLYLFVIMLLNLREEDFHPSFETHWPLGVVVGGVFILIFSWVLARSPTFAPLGKYSVQAVQAQGMMKTIGTVLYTEYLLPFEIASLVLLAAIVGAVVLAKRKIE